MDQPDRLRKVRFTDARLKAAPSEKLTRHVTVPNLEDELERFQQFLTVDMAHTVMLAEQGIIRVEDAAKILKILREIEKLGPDKFPIDPQYGSFLLQVEAYLFDRIGEEVGGKMHTGRSRNDQSGAVGRLYARDALLRIIGTLLDLQEAVLEQAMKHVDTIMPGYTHIQHAQPVTLGHYLTCAAYIFERDFQRLQGAFQRANLNALGGAAIAGTSWPLDRERTTILTGCDGLVVHSKDTIAFTPEYPAEILAVCSILMSNLGRLVSELYLWSTYEFGMVEPDDAFCGTSSIMPQKKNPYSMESILGQVGLAVGWLSSGLGVLRTATSTDAVQLTTGQLRLSDVVKATVGALDLSAGMIRTLIVKKDVMKERSGVFWSTASNLADIIVREKKLSFRTAHHVVGRLVRIAIEEGKPPSAVTGEMLDRAALETIGRKFGMSDLDVGKALDPVEFVNTRVTTGSTNPKEVKRMIEDCQSKLKDEREWIQAKTQQIQQSRKMLDVAIDAIISNK